ncbi:MAG: tRNA pseudouridine(38-40) synthase TruA [Gammaproteobacteria bacterium HGW-Gammaproteobacteria-8]|nr:MAG: tRNA pseudouridine(38-40) synthase TruA [Gammaproteobacteria bacterium HGW-Gammaproteobacteria-8]
MVEFPLNHELSERGKARMILGLEYDGSRFYGFQRQRQRPTVQEVLEDALEQVADHAVTVHCAGRTDTGVHALGQVVHFDTGAERSERGWVLGCNSHLPAGVSVLWARLAEPGFHARFSARSRSYRYRILNRWTRPGLLHGRVSWERRSLDAQRMHQAAQHLVGEHDFSSFRAPGCQARHARRMLHRIAVTRLGDEVRIEVSANAFLYHMVRNIAGTLIDVGVGKRDPDWLAEVLALRDRARAGVTATPDGLYFVGVEYPDYPELPAGPAAARPRG